MSAADLDAWARERGVQLDDPPAAFADWLAQQAGESDDGFEHGECGPAVTLGRLTAGMR
jgi:hypothetical protein